MRLSDKEIFALGNCYTAFGYGDIDGAVHCILPSVDSDTDVWSNGVFQLLADRFLNLSDDLSVDNSDIQDIAETYRLVIEQWLKEMDIDLGLNELEY
ncbi:hypothetical protein LCGC14_0481890 [marine sediment metagenome]|uniref:Uncharacterized protein n=1 Tax=marine sediment metagenome TaxID=412755 RepID=A0A0F9SEK3_9ZZZZ